MVGMLNPLSPLETAKTVRAVPSCLISDPAGTTLSFSLFKTKPYNHESPEAKAGRFTKTAGIVANNKPNAGTIYLKIDKASIVMDQK